MSNIYYRHNVYRYFPHQTYLYICLERNSDKKFAVMQMEIIKEYKYFSIQETESQFLELFSEIDPTDRCDWFNSLDEAIVRHDKDFEN